MSNIKINIDDKDFIKTVDEDKILKLKNGSPYNYIERANLILSIGNVHQFGLNFTGDSVETNEQNSKNVIYSIISKSKKSIKIKKINKSEFDFRLKVRYHNSEESKWLIDIIKEILKKEIDLENNEEIVLQGEVTLKDIAVIEKFDISAWQYNIKLTSPKSSKGKKFRLINIPLYLESQDQLIANNFTSLFLVPKSIFKNYSVSDNFFTTPKQINLFLQEYLSHKINIKTIIQDRKKHIIEFYKRILSDDFIRYIFAYRIGKYSRSKPDHEFVISKTKDYEDEELGYVGEKALNKYLIQDNYFKNPLKLKYNITWLNQQEESHEPYDFTINIEGINYFIDAKTTRHKKDVIFYISIKELEFILKYPDRYFIARISYMDVDIEYNGIKLNSELIVNFYQLNNKSLQVIIDNFDEWKDHHGADKIRFTVDHFIEIKAKKEYSPVDALILNQNKIVSYIEKYIFEKHFKGTQRIIEVYDPKNISLRKCRKLLQENIGHCSSEDIEPFLWAIISEKYGEETADKVFEEL